MVRKARKPVVLFIDEAHDIHGHTLNGLKRLMELITAGGGKLSVVLVGHPHLQNDLRRATMEEIGNRTSKFDFVALGGQRREFLPWLLETCLEDGVDPDSVITAQTQNFLVERLSTLLPFAEHLNRAFTDAFNLGAEKVSREIVENTLSAGFDSLDVKLARIGYTPKALAERFDAHPGGPALPRGHLYPDPDPEAPHRALVRGPRSSRTASHPRARPRAWSSRFLATAAGHPGSLRMTCAGCHH